LPVGPSGWSITAETPWRFDRLKLREIELDNRLLRPGRGAISLIVRQYLQPRGILRLEVRQRGDRVIPALDRALSLRQRASDARFSLS
jgi:hypothetical protein